MQKIAQENHEACAGGNDYQAADLAAESGALHKFIAETQWARIVEHYQTLNRLGCTPLESVNIGGVDIWLDDVGLANCFYDGPKHSELILFCIKHKYTRKDISAKVQESLENAWARARKDQDLLNRLMGRAGMPTRLIKNLKGEDNV